MDTDEDQSELSGRMRYLLSPLFIWWAFLIPFICQLLHHPLFLLAQAFKGCGQSLGVHGQMQVSLVLHLTALMPVQIPYLHIAQQLHPSDDIYCGIWGLHVAVGLWKNL